jgi:hypothetical protein
LIHPNVNPCWLASWLRFAPILNLTNRKEKQMTDDYNNDFDGMFQTEPTLTRSDVRQEVQKTLADIAQYSAQTTAGVAHAIKEVSSEFPDFEARMPQMRTVCAEEPVLGDAISLAENNPAAQSYLRPLYKLAYRLTQAPAQRSEHSERHSQSESPRPSGLTEESIFAGTEASKSVSLSAQNRKSLIASLEEKGILDVEF